MTIGPETSALGDALAEAPALILVIGADGAVETASRRMAEALGLASENLPGRPLASLLWAPEEATGFAAGGAVRMRRADGMPLDLHVEASPCDGGRVVAAARSAEAACALGHAVRTPMNAILGYAQLLQLDPLDPAQGAHVEAILAAGRTLMAILEKELDGALADSAA